MESNRKTISSIADVVEEYQQQRSNFVNAVAHKDDVRKSWNISETQKNLNETPTNLLNGADTNTQILLAEMNQKLMTRALQRTRLIAGSCLGCRVLADYLNQYVMVPPTRLCGVIDRTTAYALRLLPTLMPYKDNVLAYLQLIGKSCGSAGKVMGSNMTDWSMTCIYSARAAKGPRLKINNAQLQLTIAAIAALLLAC